MKLRKIFAHPVWFLIGFLIFAVGGIRYAVQGDTIGAVIYCITGFLFLVGFVGQVLSRKKRDRKV